jgi:cytochrome c553
MIVGLVVAFGCGQESQPPAPMPEPSEHAASAEGRDRPTEVEMVAWMEAHYRAVILAHDALLQGNLEAFKSQLALVPEQQLPPGSPEAWQPFQARLQAAATEGEKVADLESAATTLASVVLACGTCHTALGTGPIYGGPAPKEGTHVLEEAMLEHQWVTERMWEGVTGPWDDAWIRGAEALAEIQVFGDLGPEFVVSDELRLREQALREIGEEAKATTDLEARAALYGRLLSTCGDCHRTIGAKFGS